MTLANPNWNWDLIITGYTIFMLAAGYFIGTSISKYSSEKALIAEYRKMEEMRVIINGLLSEISDAVDDVLTVTKELA